ncbi:hypothetical protein L227DRAFT_369964 [Lentinus tigrinus ALCF2SS1-6]|uniref:Uncharacterized protein n=1 Tax=Lentinus tigrinus ALCF2SS1-6 TaxID=1328759 RepID=A0A5C2RR92_9APHY|nr:hypothetical protein L227DRAFT_369964 [Lentinus tigrinus ALCF2SS1-6]
MDAAEVMARMSSPTLTIPFAKGSRRAVLRTSSRIIVALLNVRWTRSDVLSFTVPAHARHGTRWSSGPRSPHIPWDEDVFGAGSTFSTCVPALSASLQCPTSMGCRRQSRPERMPSKLATPASQWCGVHHVRSTSPGTLIGFQEGTRRTELDCANGLTVTSLIHPSLEGPHDYELRSMRTLVSVSRAVISQAY